jgi:hypothetical protein
MKASTTINHLAHEGSDNNHHGQRKQAKWLMMVYMAADDVLANFAMKSVEELSHINNSGVITVALLGVDEFDVHNLYAFDGATPPGSLLGDCQEPWRRGNLTDPKTLTAFLDWVHDHYVAENYCLALWGHGPELLYEGTQQNHTDSSAGTFKGKRGGYLTPVDLKSAILKSQLNEEREVDGKKALDVIAMDACSMSMFEYAYELRDLVAYMVASQEEVSDFSFPYDTILLPSKTQLPPADFCQDFAKTYIDAYQGYFYQIQTGLRPATISLLNLEQAKPVAEALHEFVEQLLPAAGTPDGEEAILDARRRSQGFVGGLFVDLCDFCEKLMPEIPAGELKTKCERLRNALKKNGNGDFILRNAHVDISEDLSGEPEEKLVFKPGSCHGLSIYFPYLTENERDYLNRFEAVKGLGDSTGAGGTLKSAVEIENMAARNIRYASRWQVIEDTEDYYHKTNFEFASDTQWYEFIRLGWSRILAKHERKELNLRYSAEQCVRNLLSVDGPDRESETPTVVTVGELVA